MTLYYPSIVFDIMKRSKKKNTNIYILVKFIKAYLLLNEIGLKHSLGNN